MRNNNFRQDNMNQRDLQNDRLDRDLNAALARFAAAEPRKGLEERILATVRAKQQRFATRSWWRWPVLATLAAALVVSVSVAWKSVKRQQTTVAHSSAAKHNTRHTETRITDNVAGSPIRHEKAASEMRRKPNAIGHRATIVVSAVKLDQFPSPLPLSEQEKILARYVTKYPEHAALIAQARTEELRRDRAEEVRESAHALGENLQLSNK
jgi:hypothetical protein